MGGGGHSEEEVFAGALSGANKGVETPPKGNSGRYECLSESPVQMIPRKSTAKRRLSDGQPQVLRPVDQAQIGHRSSQLTTLVRVAEAELGLGGQQKNREWHLQCRRRRLRKEKRWRPSFLHLKKFWPPPFRKQKKEKSCLMESALPGQQFQPAGRREREKKLRSKRRDQIHQQDLRTWHPESQGQFREEGRDGGSDQQQPSLHRNSLLQN